MGPLFFFTKGSNFSVFLERGNIFIVGIGRFTQAVLVSVSSLARTVYLLFSNDLGVGTVGQLVSTVQTENPNLLLCPGKVEEHPFCFVHHGLQCSKYFSTNFLSIKSDAANLMAGAREMV